MASKQLVLLGIISLAIVCKVLSYPDDTFENTAAIHKLQQSKSDASQTEHKATSASGSTLSEYNAEISKLLAAVAAPERDGDMVQRGVDKRQVGDRRLKCILYNPVNGKCLRHKLNFIWG